MEKKIAVTLDRVTYSETRTINIGDYESVKASLSFSTGFVPINKEETLIVIDGMAHETIHPKETYDQAASRAVKAVKSLLDKRELMIRRRSSDHVDFDTEGKASDMGIIKKKKKKKVELNESIRIDGDEIEV